MEFDAIPYEVADVDERALASYASRGQPMLVILAASRDGKDTTELGRLIDAYGLRSLEGHRAGHLGPPTATVCTASTLPSPASARPHPDRFEPCAADAPGLGRPGCPYTLNPPAHKSHKSQNTLRAGPSRNLGSTRSPGPSGTCPAVRTSPSTV